MSTLLRILILAACEDKSQQIANALGNADYNLQWHRIDNEVAYRDQLSQGIDLIVANHKLATLDGPQALRILREEKLDIPFIIVTDALDEEAITCMRLGAADCLLTEKLSQLGKAVQRARYNRRAERSLARALTDIAAALTSTLDLDEVLDRILDNVGRVVPHHGANIMLIEDGIARVRRFKAYHKAYELSQQILDEGFRVDETTTLQRMMQTRRAIVVPDTTAYEPWVNVQKSWSRSYAGAPIIQSGDVIGFLNLDASVRDFFTEEHADRLQALADQVGVALRNAQLYEAEQRRRKVAETLTEAAAMLNATLELDEVLTRILQQLGQVIPYDSASVQELEQGRLVVRAVKGFEEPTRIIDVALPVSEDLPNAAILESKRPLSLRDVSSTYPTFGNVSEFGSLSKIHSWLGLPLLLNGQVLGLITLDRYEVKPFTAEEVKLATTLANHAANALHNARMYHALENYSEFLESAVASRTVELQQAADQMEAILSHSAQAIMLLGSSGRIETGNPALTRLFGYDVEEVLGHEPGMLVEQEEKDRLDEALGEALNGGKSQQLQVVARRKDQSVFDADLALSPIQAQGQVTNMVCSLHDISGLKEVERMKDAFVSNVSHELRTPISSLKLYHGLLARTDEKHDVYMARLEREIDRLSVIIEDLLRLSRLEQGGVALSREPLDLLAMAGQYVNDRAPLAQEAGLRLELDRSASPTTVLADPSLLGQVLSILLTNAINYTPAGGMVCVGIYCKRARDQRWAGLYVRDSGPGIEPAEKARLFERFFRGQAALASGSSGTGLGLSIAREIVRLHHGRITVESRGKAGEGATFTIWLPLPETTGSPA